MEEERVNSAAKEGESQRGERRKAKRAYLGEVEASTSG